MPISCFKGRRKQSINVIIINKIDFEKLANRNTSTPGFGKADFVDYYNELKQES